MIESNNSVASKWNCHFSSSLVSTAFELRTSHVLRVEPTSCCFSAQKIEWQKNDNKLTHIHWHLRWHTSAVTAHSWTWAPTHTHTSFWRLLHSTETSVNCVRSLCVFDVVFPIRNRHTYSLTPVARSKKRRQIEKKCSRKSNTLTEHRIFQSKTVHIWRGHTLMSMRANVYFL